ncbi:MAG: lactate racemase domain-containing protein [Actinocatenispora sp.]
MAEVAAGIGGARDVLADADVRRFVAERLRADEYDGQRVCVIVPDGTRTCPLPLLLDAVYEALAPRATALTILVALGTHPAMSESQLAGLLGGPPAERFPRATVRNHEWWDPERLVRIGHVDAARISRLSEGRLDTGVDITVNRAVLEHDVLLVVGPVFPHEVVGFSGGNKYLFPGIAGQQVIDVSHWLGALITSSAMIGTRGDTPVRQLINAAAELVPCRRRAFSMVVESGSTNLHSIAYGSPEASWARAADVAAEAHVRYLDRPVRRVLSVIPGRYDEMWTAAKGMYKVEPVVAEGGEVVIYAPHVRTVSHTHGPAIEKIGYHCRDYFTGQWERFRDEPWGVLAHSTHLRGAGRWDPVTGERCRATVTLATGIDERTTRALGLEYRDPDGIDVSAWAEDPETLVVPNAGEVLFRLRA